MMSHRLAGTLASLYLALVAAACGGKVFVDTPSAGGAGGAGSNSTSSSSSTVGASAAGGAIGDTTVSTGTGPVETTVVGSSAVTTTGSGGSAAPVFCNGMPCNTGEICCFNPNGPGDHCGASGSCDQGYVELACNSPDDCPGGVCCASLTTDGQSLTGIACQTSCGAPNELVVCTQMQADVCPSGTSCHQMKQLGTGGGYRFCN